MTHGLALARFGERDGERQKDEVAAGHVGDRNRRAARGDRRGRNVDRRSRSAPSHPTRQGRDVARCVRRRSAPRSRGPAPARRGAAGRSRPTVRSLGRRTPTASAEAHGGVEPARQDDDGTARHAVISTLLFSVSHNTMRSSARPALVRRAQMSAAINSAVGFGQQVVQVGVVEAIDDFALQRRRCKSAKSMTIPLSSSSPGTVTSSRYEWPCRFLHAPECHSN